MEVMLGVDIGGTKVAVAAISREGEVQGEVFSRPTDTTSAESFVRSVIDILKQAREVLGDDIRGIGLGCAGTVDWTRGMIVESPNLPIREEPLAGKVSEALALPVVLDNDANLATLAEARIGVARGLRHVVMLTLGTGVGGGIFLDGRLYRGANGSAGELGHTIVLGNNEACLCGRRGCLEVYASGTALERYAREIAEKASAVQGRTEPRGPGEEGYQDEYGALLNELREKGELEGEVVGRLALEGDPAARDAVAEVARWLGVGLANFANIFNPEMIVIGGGLSTLGELLLAPARELMRQVSIQPNGEVARVEAACLGNSAGVVGAGLAAWETLGEAET